MKRRISSVNGMSATISKTPKVDAKETSPSDQYCHISTEKTSFFLLDSINGMEKARKAWTETQIQPAAKAGNSSGMVIASSVRDRKSVV